MKRSLAFVVLFVALSGCVNVGGPSNAPAVVYYVLNDAAPPAAVVPQVPANLPVLRVLDTTAGRFYDSDQLIYSRSANTRGQYQFARWTERPGKRFADLMRTRIERQGVWQVSATGGFARGDVLLDTELVEFYHDATSHPGQLRLVLRAELVSLKQRTLLGRRVFEQQVPLTSYDAAGAAQASSQVVSLVLDDLTAWLATLK
jgi:cholesterol transport system auxiliary component